MQLKAQPGQNMSNKPFEQPPASAATESPPSYEETMATTGRRPRTHRNTGLFHSYIKAGTQPLPGLQAGAAPDAPPNAASDSFLIKAGKDVSLGILTVASAPVRLGMGIADAGAMTAKGVQSGAKRFLGSEETTDPLWKKAGKRAGLGLTVAVGAPVGFSMGVAMAGVKTAGGVLYGTAKIVMGLGTAVSGGMFNGSQRK